MLPERVHHAVRIEPFHAEADVQAERVGAGPLDQGQMLRSCANLKHRDRRAVVAGGTCPPYRLLMGNDLHVGQPLIPLERALEIDDRPVVIDFVVSADAMVWPMVPQGVSNSYIQYAREHAPAFDQED